MRRSFFEFGITEFKKLAIVPVIVVLRFGGIVGVSTVSQVGTHFSFLQVQVRCPRLVLTDMACGHCRRHLVPITHEARTVISGGEPPLGPGQFNFKYPGCGFFDSG